jgi:hypothetical protein
MTEQYCDELKKMNVSTSWCVPGIDDGYKPKLVLGFIGRMINNHHADRKGSDLLQKISSLDFVELKATNGHIDELSMPNYYRSLDYVLVTSKLEGGPMCIPEGISSGKKIICPHSVGFANTFKQYVLHYEFNNFDSLYNLLIELYKEKQDMYDYVKKYTWKNWASHHNDIFMELINAKK